MAQAEGFEQAERVRGTVTERFWATFGELARLEHGLGPQALLRRTPREGEAAAAIDELAGRAFSQIEGAEPAEIAACMADLNKYWINARQGRS